VTAGDRFLSQQLPAQSGDPVAVQTVLENYFPFSLAKKISCFQKAMSLPCSTDASIQQYGFRPKNMGYGIRGEGIVGAA
jgi:hypothetical protein